MWEIEEPDHYRLGRSLREEVLACILGGYGIPAEVGLAAYGRLRAVPAEELYSQATVEALLSKPLTVAGRSVRYRFAGQKARHVSASMAALNAINEEAPDRDLRNALVALPGIGPKTASWVVRNWRSSDHVSILDGRSASSSSRGESNATIRSWRMPISRSPKRSVRVPRSSTPSCG